jgi:poly(A) polymerase
MNERRRTARDAAVAVVERLREAGFEALFAGGCVRDMLLDQEPQDYDVATNARPEEIRRLFPRGRLVGAQFGVVLVRRFGWDLEVATYRSDGTYSDGRRPDQVEFGSREEDAQRRDFTINGMFFDPLTEAVIDHVGGRADLDARLIRTIGAPEDRFAEDHLRMLRAVRFAARLGFDVEPPTMTAIQQHAAKLTAISAERIWSELEKILTGAARARGWRLLCEANLRPHLAPEFDWSAEVDEAIARRLEALPAEPSDAAGPLAIVLHALAPAAVHDSCRSLRINNQLRAEVAWLLGALPDGHRATELELARVKQLRAHERFDTLLRVLAADLAARSLSEDPWRTLRDRASAIPDEDVAPPPLLTGLDLQEMGIADGPVMGKLLHHLYWAQLNEAIRTRDEAIAHARRWIARSDNDTAG